MKKDLSIEEKAKRYDEAFGRAKAIRFGNPNSVTANVVCEDIFPELKESEDERIKREILELVSIAGNGNQFEEIKDWLEKKTIIIPKFRVGDEIKTANEESLTITKIDEKGYWSEDLFICGFDEECVWDSVDKQSVEPDWCHHKVDFSGCSEEYRKAYYDGWNNCNMQYSQSRTELDNVVKYLINVLKHCEGDEEAIRGTGEWHTSINHIIEVLEKYTKSVKIE